MAWRWRGWPWLLEALDRAGWRGLRRGAACLCHCVTSRLKISGLKKIGGVVEKEKMKDREVERGAARPIDRFSLPFDPGELSRNEGTPARLFQHSERPG
jgi:hypothetical protein